MQALELGVEKREGLLISTLGADEGLPFAMAHQQVRTSLGELYSTYFNDFFVLKTGVTISGQPAETFSTSDLVLKCGYIPPTRDQLLSERGVRGAGRAAQDLRSVPSQQHLVR